MQLLHQPGGRVADHQGHGLGQTGEGVLLGGLIGHVQGVGLGRHGHVYHRVGQVYAALGHAQKVAGLIGRHGHFEGL